MNLIGLCYDLMIEAMHVKKMIFLSAFYCVGFSFS